MIDLVASKSINNYPWKNLRLLRPLLRNPLGFTKEIGRLNKHSTCNLMLETIIKKGIQLSYHKTMRQSSTEAAKTAEWDLFLQSNPSGKHWSQKRDPALHKRKSFNLAVETAGENEQRNRQPLQGRIECTVRFITDFLRIEVQVGLKLFQPAIFPIRSIFLKTMVSESILNPLNFQRSK